MRGRAEAVRDPRPLIRLHPERVVSWGLDGRRSAPSVRGAAESDTRPASRISAIHHVAIYTPDPDRLASFYGEVFGAKLIDTTGGGEEQRKCAVALTQSTTLHMFEDVRPDGSRRTGAYDAGSLNHIAIAIDAPDHFVAVRTELLQRGLTDESVYDAGDWHSIHAVDPDGLFLEVVLPARAGWRPPFATTSFAPPTRDRLS